MKPNVVRLADLNPDERRLLALIAADKAAKEARGRSRPESTTEGTAPSKEKIHGQE